MPRRSAVAYLKPSAFTRSVFNPLAMRLGLSGTQTLVVPGRRTGRPMQVPVIPVEHDGSRYVVSTRGEADWVRNLRAAGRGELRTRRGAEPFAAVEVPEDERGPVIDAYRRAAGRAVTGYWRKLPDPADHPVFRLEPGDAGMAAGSS
jgi:deazaflavin-dependent oxidoreductase (nitroreductase family)